MRHREADAIDGVQAAEGLVEDPVRRAVRQQDVGVVRDRGPRPARERPVVAGVDVETVDQSQFLAMIAVNPTFALKVMRAHGEAFATVRPACTGVVCGLLDPRWLVELEVEAVLT